ncbi:MAG: ERCC4 domain-containing protein [Candidatus Nanoarchaeia archaeon]
MNPNPFLDIFSKKEKIISKPKKQISWPKIIIDYREKNSLIPSELVYHGFEIEFRELKVADYIVRDVAIERKTVQDFISSMINKRLIKQLQELQQYSNKLLIIEGIEEQALYNDKEKIGINPNAIRGFLLSILLKYKIPVIFTKDYEDTAKFIAVLSKKPDKESSIGLNAKKKARNKKEQIQYILEGFPGIGPATAKKLLKEFKTLKNILNASEFELQKIIGKKAGIFRILEENY